MLRARGCQPEGASFPAAGSAGLRNPLTCARVVRRVPEENPRPPGARPPVPVLVLGEGITGLGVMRVLGRRRIPLYVTGAADSFVTRSRWYRPLPGMGPIEESESALSAAHVRLDVGRMVLLPCSDAWTTAVSRMDPDLRERFPSSIAAPDVLERLVDKACFAETLQRMGLPHPHTIVLREPGALEGVPPESLPRYFLKPTRSRPFARKFRVKAMRVQSRENARRLLEDVRGLGISLMLQEYIPGPPTSHYFLDGFIDRRGRVCGMLARRRLRMFPEEFGNSTLTESIPRTQVSGAEETLRALLSGIGYRGVFSAEFKLDARDGSFRILEVNARPWWFVEFAAACGVDVCSMAYRDALDEDVELVSGYRVGRRCVYPRRDLEWRRAQPSGTRSGLAALLVSWIGARQLTFRWDDPRPGLREIAAVGRAMLHRVSGA